MAGIYLHIPFCKQSCSYCNFYFTTSRKLEQEFLKALQQEIASRYKEGNGEDVKTIYFGGGTPSLLSSKDINALLVGIRKHYRVTDQAEITMECNPDDLSESKIKELQQAGVNRLSVGIQSFRSEDLQLLNRAHSAKEALEAVSNAKKAGFSNITIDLIYGIPGLSINDWKANIQQAIDLNIQHVSAYCLTIEEQTRLYKDIRLGKTVEESDEVTGRQFEILIEELEAAGFEHYEISNFAKRGFRSIHNSNYWTGASYLGFGPSAHSYSGNSRSWNIAHTFKYIQAIKENTEYRESELLSKEDQMNEMIMVSLRTKEGIDMNLFRTRFGDQATNQLLRLAGSKYSSDILLSNHDRLFLSPQGKFISDAVIVDLMFDT